VQEKGYQAHLVCTALSIDKAVLRLFDRNEQGKLDPNYAIAQPFQDPSYTILSEDSSTTPEDIFDKLSKSPKDFNLSSATKFDTDVAKGESPKMIFDWQDD